jgi:hypothetical protein
VSDETHLRLVDLDALAEALSRLAARNYVEEGIPMLLILGTAGAMLAGGAQNASRPTELDDSRESLAQTAGQTFRRAVAGLDRVGRERTAGDLARIVEWIADERFGFEALGAGQGDAQG